MTAVVYDRYGPPEVLRLEDVERPTPGDHEVLVRVRATTVNRTDCAFRAAKPAVNRPFSGLLRPRRRILGTELAGEVEAVGAAVTQFAPRDRVFGVNPSGFGAHAELMCVSEDAPLALMPAGVSFEEAAAVCDGAIIAMSCLRRAGLRGGQRILVPAVHEGERPAPQGPPRGGPLPPGHRSALSPRRRGRRDPDVETGQKTGNVVLTVGGDGVSGA